MQRRMEMGLRKYRPQGMEIINYAAYQWWRRAAS